MNNEQLSERLDLIVTFTFVMLMFLGAFSMIFGSIKLLFFI